MDEPTSHDTPSDAFDIARRGYDRRQVDTHVSAANERISMLERRIEELEHLFVAVAVLANPGALHQQLDIRPHDLRG